MLGHQAKRGVITALERVFAASGDKLGSFEVLWTGKTAGVIHSRSGRHVNVKLIMPAIDDLAQVNNGLFNNLIGYDIHELGHVWFTDTKHWDFARKRHGQFVSNLINGLEDPRIERKVIESDFAPNSAVLFETLINSVLDRDGYIQPDDKANIPFLLAVEGRRMNGYRINVPDIIDQSPWAVPIRHALNRASSAKDTQTIVNIAIELFESLKDSDKQPDSQSGQDDQDDQDGDQDSDQDSGQDGDQDGDQDGGQDGQDGAESGDQEGGKGKVSPDQQAASGGDGWTNLCGRSVEPSDFIERELSEHKCEADRYDSRPAVSKPEFARFNFY